MASYTTRHNLKKPSGADLYNIADSNGNMDKIDISLPVINPVAVTALSGASLISHNLMAIDYGAYGIVTGNIMFKTASDVAIGSSSIFGLISESYRPSIIEGSGYQVPVLSFSGFDSNNKFFVIKVSSGSLGAYPITAPITANTMCWTNLSYRYK